jgi:hypothetical protein
MTQTDFAGSQFPDDKGGHGPQYVGIFTTKQSNVAASPRTFYPEFYLSQLQHGLEQLQLSIMSVKLC